MSRTSNASLYEEDFYEWSLRTAELVRQGRWQEVDPESVAEEIESLGRSERREIGTRLALLIAHLLKWQFQPDKHEIHGRSWRSTINEQRRQITKLTTEMPSLQRLLCRDLAEAYERAVILASRETGPLQWDFPQTCPYSLEQILDTQYWPGDSQK
jgi:uncharacterized protein DUF29